MPRKNVDKSLHENAYYHVFNKSIGNKLLFKDKDDYKYFELLLSRYLDGQANHDKYARKYSDYRGELSLISFCLTSSSIQLLLYQKEDKLAMPLLMRSLSNSYTSYYNSKYRKIGPIFEGTYKASYIDNTDFLIHVSRHIILQADKFSKWPYTSLPYFLRQKQANWLDVKLMHSLFEKNPGSYLAFLADEQGYKNSLKYISGILADR